MPPEAHTHPSPRLTLLPHLLPLLPHTLPLVRRLQFHFQSPYAHVLSTLPPTHPPSSSSATTPFAALYVDRSRAPETECWLFSTLELPSCDADSQTAAAAATATATALPHLLALLAHVPRLPLPPSYPAATQSPSHVLVGAVHRAVLECLAGGPLVPEAGRTVISGPSVTSSTPAFSPHASNDGAGEWRASSALPGGCVRDHTVPYQKFLFRPETVARAAANNTADEVGEETALLEELGLAWTTVREGEFPLVASRTAIPRSGRTLRLLGSVGLRRVVGASFGPSSPFVSPAPLGEEGPLVAWAFLGPDGSLTSLHVEEEFRGRGLGKLVTRRLFTVLGRGGAEAGFVGVREGEEWGHSDVAVDNKGSVGVARGLGGGEGWECFWGWVDLGEVERMGAGCVSA